MHTLFETLDSKHTGLDFNNNLTYTPAFNLFKYMYFYNGSGVGAGDFNNDGLIDLFFASNQGENKLYLNEGALHFKDATVAATIPQDRLLIETDSPFLAPVPHRGKPCEPAFVVDTARFLADLRKTGLDDLAQITRDNFHRLFSKAT